MDLYANVDTINSSVLQLLYDHRYIFAFLGAMLEGNFTIILCGVLFKFGYFNVWGLFAALILGYFINGIAWYVLGRIFGDKIINRWMRKSKTGSKIVEKLEIYFQRHSMKTIFLTRITYSVSMFSFMLAGSLKINFKKFLIVSMIAGICWVLMMFGIGYGFGAGLQTMDNATKGLAWGIIIAMVILIFLAAFSFIFWMRRFAKTQFVKDLENHDLLIVSKAGEFIRKAFHHKDKKKS